ncbi:MAG: hypothetical protein IT318_18345 [Anaerolineales bacterium]|nr:hypothetical protein [Anaerolineales bacterium]
MSRATRRRAHPADAETAPVKMSDVLAEFVAPYLELAETPAAYEQLLKLAVLAWNLALFPPAERAAMTDEAFSPERLHVDEATRRDMRLLAAQLILRKLADFAGDARYIVDFKVEHNGDDYELRVAATLPGQPPEAPGVE